MVNALISDSSFQTILIACLVLLFWRIREVEKVISKKLENGLTTQISELSGLVKGIQERLND